ncbi:MULTISPECIES: DUF418 domain-containing protein [unclassified Caulobacter]|jgi:uncharacterized protein|uniref:DUF418 domain-containing protein n=1 Tax=unclassified Caulobacter TaxID=2648921 RepID=UPI000701124F|nr:MULTISPECIES: DUF418 domain-containing protein [unclassified Caulobacter]KQV62296.1 hypothetical protein ASC62_01785 [Caulobacter sp. Root342]KQV63216.1 hypothetical protein ASC70_22700 [Caulobacter sp. Root343]
MTKDRIVLLDSLRGLGVLGILLCNAPDFAVPPPLSESAANWPHGTGPATLGVWVVTQWLFQRKFVTLFAMLFGVSIFLVGGERSDLERGAILRKRLSWMVVFGLLHGFAVWFGDVLLSYALAGFAVLLARSWAPRRLIRTGVTIWAAFTGLMLVGMSIAAFMPHEPAQAVLEAAKEVAKGKAAEAQYGGTFVQSLVQNAKDRLGFLTAEPIIFVMTSSLMLIGLGCFKAGVLTGEASDRLYRRLLVLGLSASVLIGGLFVAQVALGLPRALGLVSLGLQWMLAPLTTLAYVALMVFAARSKAWSAIPKALAPVGQMAFTNYLSQSLIMTVIFYGGRGLSLHGQVDRPGLAAIVVTIWVAQILWSRWWMDRFEMGPLEWVWRRLYRGPTPIRRPKLEPVIA